MFLPAQFSVIVFHFLIDSCYSVSLWPALFLRHRASLSGECKSRNLAKNGLCGKVHLLGGVSKSLISSLPAQTCAQRMSGLWFTFTQHIFLSEDSILVAWLIVIKMSRHLFSSLHTTRAGDSRLAVVAQIWNLTSPPFIIWWPYFSYHLYFKVR